MQNHQLATLLRRFTIAATAHHSALEALDAERADHHARMTAALHKAIMAAGHAGKDRFISLLEHPDPVVAGMAAVYSITTDTEKSMATLRRLAKDPGLLGFRAAAAIDRWNSGEWSE